MLNFYIFIVGGIMISIFVNENNINLFDLYVRDFLGNVCYSQGIVLLFIFVSIVSLVEYLSNFYVNFEYNLFFMLIRIEFVDILGINSGN